MSSFLSTDPTCCSMVSRSSPEPRRSAVLVETPMVPISLQSHPCCLMASHKQTSSFLLIRLSSGQPNIFIALVLINQQPPVIKNHLPSPVPFPPKLYSPFPPFSHEGGSNP